MYTSNKLTDGRITSGHRALTPPHTGTSVPCVAMPARVDSVAFSIPDTQTGPVCNPAHYECMGFGTWVKFEGQGPWSSRSREETRQ